MSNTELKEYTLDRDDDVDLVFEGILIDEASNKDNAEEWIEIELYKTKAGKYVLYITSGLQDWPDHYKALVFDGPSKIVPRIKSFFGGGFPRLARDFVKDLHEKDPEFKSCGVERIE